MKHPTWLQNHATAGNEDIMSCIRDMINEKGDTCISIIVPTHRFGRDRRSDLTSVREAIAEVRNELAGNHVQRAEQLFAVYNLMQQIHFGRNKDGVGIFVSASLKKLIRFPFPVTRRVLINQYFYLPDLLYIENYSLNYYLLNISAHKMVLFEGQLDHLEEVRDENFPVTITDDYEYSRPSQSSSHAGYAHEKAFEKDKSILKRLRIEKEYHSVDKKLNRYLSNSSTPLILSGPKEDISIYRSITSHEGNIVAAISNNYSNIRHHDLELFAWLQIQSHVDKQKQQLMEDAIEKTGTGKGVYGIEKVWSCAKDGRGLLLFVERDLSIAAFITEEKRLSLQQPQHNSIKHPDVVNEVINEVLHKNGKVIIIEKGALHHYNGILMTLRY